MNKSIIVLGIFVFFYNTVYSGNNGSKRYTYTNFKNHFSQASYSYNEDLRVANFNFRTATYYSSQSSQFLSGLDWDANFTAAAILNGICLASLGLNALTQKSKYSIDNYIYVVSFEVVVTSLLMWNHYR